MTSQDRAHQEGPREGVFQDWSNSVETRGKWHDKSVVMGHAVTDAIVRAARVGSGMQVLDLACGTGDPALTLSTLVGPSGGVTATDLVPEMLEAAQANAAKQGLTNITFQQADAESLAFSDRKFDAVTCRLGVMLFANVAQALSEILRVLKPGGHAAFVAQGLPEHNPWQECILRVFGNYLELPVPEPDSPHPHRFARPGALSKALEDAGFNLVEEYSPTVPYPWPGTPEDYWESRRGQGALFPRLISRLAPEQHDQVIHEVIESISEYYDGQHVNFTACMVVASGVRRAQ